MDEQMGASSPYMVPAQTHSRLAKLPPNAGDVSDKVENVGNKEAKKYDSGKADFSLVPGCVKFALISSSKEYDEIKELTDMIWSAIGHWPDNLKEYLLDMSLSEYFDGNYHAALEWICRYYLADSVLNGDDAMKQAKNLVNPLIGLEPAVRIMEFGAVKYGRNNWQKLTNFENRYSSAGDRHLGCFMAGEINDQESGQQHLAHYQCNVLFLFWKSLQPKQREQDVGEEEGSD